jgi:dihydroorotate dehydrogenase
VSLPGAVSGAPAAAAALRTVAELRAASSKYAIFGSGGVFSADDAYAMIRAGADLVQLYTALIYEGPGVVARITRGLSALLERDGHATVASAAGTA